MKIFANKSIWKKFLMIVGVIAFVGIVFPKPVAAFDIGGVLMGAVTDLFVGLADGINTLIHRIFADQERIIYIISEGFVWWRIAVGILIGVALVASGVVSLGAITLGAAIVVGLGLLTGGESSVVFQTVNAINNSMFRDDTIILPDITLTPYEIFSDEKGIFSVDFFREIPESTENTNGSGDEEHKKPIIKILQPIIRDWYKTLTLIAVIGMLSVLVYMGIRITLSSTAASKAKYKQMLYDWFIAMFLLFVMRYIMVFSNILVEQITEVVGTIKITDESSNTAEIQGVEGFLLGTKGNNGESPTVDYDMTSRIKKAYELLVENDSGETQDKYKGYFFSDAGQTQASSKEDARVLFWPIHNFTGQARMRAQLVKDQSGSADFGYIGHAIIYVALVVYTCIFIFVYVRRFIYMIFLTLISPLVALTYPIDKVKDGQAQAFNYWFREYLYNLLLQPLHLLLYMLLIGSAMSFAAEKSIYVVICLGFMVPAEKLLKEMFGFKGKTPGSMPGLATAALMMEGTRRLLGGKAPKGVPGNGGSSNSTAGQNESSAQKIKSAKTYGESSLFDGKEQKQIPENTNQKEEDNQNEETQKIQELKNDEENDKGRQYSEEERWQILRDSHPGMSDKEIAEAFDEDMPSSSKNNFKQPDDNFTEKTSGERNTTQKLRNGVGSVFRVAGKRIVNRCNR